MIFIFELSFLTINLFIYSVSNLAYSFCSEKQVNNKLDDYVF